MEKAIKTLVLGLGNELLCDEGVGVHAIRILNDMDLPGEVVLLEIGTAIMEAIPFIEMADRLIIIDAMKGGGGPGTIYRNDINNCSDCELVTTMHSFDIRSVMALIKKSEDIPIIIFGIEPEKIDWSLDLSTSVSDSIYPLIDIILPLLNSEESVDSQKKIS